jgi:N-acyl-D-aspartate/D-glutamate deacylase
MKETGRGVMQTVPDFITEGAQIRCIDELAEISKASGIMCTLAPIIHSPISNLWKESLERLEQVNAEGARVYGQSMPRPFDMNIRLSENSFLLLAMPSWAKALKMGKKDRLAYYRDPEVQERLIDEMVKSESPIFAMVRVGRVSHPENQKYKGKSLVEIAGEEGVPVPRVMLDIALREDLEAEFQMVGLIHADPDRVAEILNHDYCHIGASDAGAHIAQFCGAGDTCYMLSKHVRERGDMTLERAIYRMTHEVAEAWGISDRGLLKEGLAADVVIFDLDGIDRGEEVFVHDVPGDANRYIRHPRGVEKVLVNGAIVVDEGAYTSARRGCII